VGGDSWSSAERWMEFNDNLKYLYDPSNNLVFEVHVYFDIDASGTYKKSYEEELTNSYIGIERIQPFIKWLNENNKKVMLVSMVFQIKMKDGRFVWITL